jgi:hypothetical protein
MESTPPVAGKTPRPCPGDSPLWYLLLAVLCVAQGWLTLGLFGAERSWAAVLDDRPIVSGRHALHLYHGQLGVRSLLHQGSSSCYDPAFLAGYPKTPIFDSGCRPAELFLLAVGGSTVPRPTKSASPSCVCWCR